MRRRDAVCLTPGKDRHGYCCQPVAERQSALKEFASSLSGACWFRSACSLPSPTSFPKIALLYGLCGAYDVSRNRPITAETVRRYFIGNGVGTWLLSPLICLLDLLSLPYVNDVDRDDRICR